MKYTQVKNLINFVNTDLNADHEKSELLDLITRIENGENDILVLGARFISYSSIDEVQKCELESDLYCLGCFNASFISSVLDIDQDVIEAMQEAEAFEAIGKLIISLGKLDELQSQYASCDGYGSHFNHYDGNQLEIVVNGVDWMVFDLHD